MTIRPYKIGAVLALLSALAGTAQAQTHKMHLGPRLSYQFDAEEIGLGAQFSVPVASQLEFYPSLRHLLHEPQLALELQRRPQVAGRADLGQLALSRHRA